MTPQFDLFDGAGNAHGAALKFPEGFRYRPGLISAVEEGARSAFP
jgi:hypothetical protein